MTKRHAFIDRIAFCGLFVVATLGGVQVANAQVPMVNRPFTAFEWLARGGVDQFGTSQMGMGLPGGARLDTTPENLSGWQKAGNFGVNKQGTTGFTIGGKADIPLGNGAKATVNAVTPTTNAALAKSAGMVLKNAARIGIPAVGVVMTASALKDLFDLGKVYFDEGGTREKPVYTIRDSTQCTNRGPAGYRPSTYATDPNFSVSWTSREFQGQCQVGWLNSCSVYSWCPYFQPLDIVPKDITGIKEYITPEEAQSLIAGHQARIQAFQELIDLDNAHRVKNSSSPFGYQMPTIDLYPPSLSGPSSVPGPKSTESESIRVDQGTNTQSAPGTSTPTDPATRVTTKETKTDLKYNGDKVTATTVTTTTVTITNNVTNNTTNQGDTVKEADPETKSECEINPDSLMCQKVDLDTPTGDIPKSEKNLTYTEEDSFGGGNCPADIFANINGQSVKVYDWAQTCGYVNFYLRPLILLLGAMGALFILIPGRD